MRGGDPDLCTQMVGFVKPLIDHQANQTLYVVFERMRRVIELFFSRFVPGFGGTGATVLVPLLQKFQIIHTFTTNTKKRVRAYP